MARQGIGYQDVATAAQQLLAQGKNPTIEGIRALTKTGSSTTIAIHLRAWKNLQDNTRALCLKENLPEEIVSTLKGLWERVIDQAEEKVAVIQQAFEKTLAEFKAQYQALHEEHTRLQQHHHQMKQEKEGLSADKSALEYALRQLEDEKITSTGVHHHMTQQLQDKQDRIEELHRIHQQVQANLDHYREASREQRLLDQQRYEQIQIQLEYNAQQMRQEALMLTQQKMTAETSLERMKNSTEILQRQYDQLATAQEGLRSRLAQAEKEVVQHAQAEQHWQGHCQKAQEKIERQDAIFVDLQMSVAVLTQKLSDAQDELQKMCEKNQIITHEKWTLAQEKAQLVGQLKQFEQISWVAKELKCNI